ncbi:MAG: O-antigen ligase family protein, partial [Tsuneonella sp.]
PVFRTYETLDMVNPRYLNQAHNEPAQLLIEAGLFGAALMLGFAVWWGRRARDAWRAQPADLEVTLRRAAMLSASLFLIHSFVDYPLRTPSAAVVFAVLCALMLPANTRALRQDRARR